MASPLPSSPSVHNSPPPIPPPPPTPSFAEYKTYLETTFPKKEGFHIDSTNKVAIKIMDVEGKPSLVKIPLKFVDDNYVSTTLKKFDEGVCKNMVLAARNIGLGQEHPTTSGKVVKAVKFEIDKKTGEVTTQKVYTDNTEGQKRTGGVVAQGSSNYYWNKQSPDRNKSAKYSHAGIQLTEIGRHFLNSKREEHPLPPAQPAAPAQPAVPAQQPAVPEKKAPVVPEKKAKSPTPKKSISQDDPPGDLQQPKQNAVSQKQPEKTQLQPPPVQKPIPQVKPKTTESKQQTPHSPGDLQPPKSNAAAPVQQKATESKQQPATKSVTQPAAAPPKAQTPQQKLALEAMTSTVLLGPMDQIGSSKYRYKDLAEALLAYSENGINAKMEGKDITVKDIFTDVIKNKPKQLNESEEKLFKILEQLNGG